MVIHAHVEEVIALVNVSNVVIVVCPGEAMAMDGTFKVLVLARPPKDCDARIDVLDTMRTVMVNVA